MAVTARQRTQTVPARLRRSLPVRARRRRRVADAYRIRLEDPRRERMFWSSAGFLATFALARAVTHAVKSQRVPIGNVSAGGRHIHHSTFGILGLLGIGYAWTAQVALGAAGRSRAASRLAASLYGVSSALTLDEFALWLDMDQDDYWNRQGRKSVDATVVFAALLSLGAWGGPFFRGVASRLGR